MYALVTGASGFLGGALVRMLVSQGVQTVVLLRPGSRFEPLPGVTVFRENLIAGDEIAPTLISALRGVSHVFHCAGCSTDWARWHEYEESNVGLTLRMLALARRLPGLERLVHVSTTDVYGYPVVVGDETLPLVSTALPYNRTKLLADQLVQRAISVERLPAVIVRPSSIYGPGGKAFVTDVVAMLRQRMMLLVDGGRVRGGFVYVDDVCRGMLLAARCSQAVGRSYNLSSIDGADWRTYTGALAQVLNLPAPWLRLPFAAAMMLARAAEQPHLLGLPGRPLLTRHAVYLLGRDQQYAVGRAQQELGWRPEVLLEEGVRRSVETAGANRALTARTQAG